MPDQQQDIATAWKSFDDARRTRLLAKMSPDQKKNLRRAIETAGPHSLEGPGTKSGDRPLGGAAKRFLSSAINTVVEPIKGAYHGVIEGPQNPEEAQAASEPGMGRANLLMKRFVFDPMMSEAHQTAEEFRQSDPWSLHPSPEAKRHRELALAHGVATITPGIGPAAVGAGQTIRAQSDTGDVAGAWGTLAGTLAQFAAPEAVGKLVKGTLGPLRERVAPGTVHLAGEKVPVSVGEWYPQSKAGRTYTRLKRSGVAPERFGAFDAAQQKAVKNVVRKTAEASGYTPPISTPARGATPFVAFAEEPAVAMKGAEEATFAQGTMLYSRLDASAAAVPSTFAAASKVTRQAIARAEKLGVSVDTSGITSVLVDAHGQPVSAQAINAADRLDGIRSGRYVNQRVGNTVEVLDAKTGQPVDPNAGVNTGIQAQVFSYAAKAPDDIPITTFIKVRSELLKMQRASADPALRFKIGNEVGAMDAAMEAALGKGSALHQTWQTANRLWTKGYVLKRVGEAVRASVKGTPQAVQASGMVPLPTELQGASLAKRLNKLAEDGTPARAGTPATPSTLEKAFTKDEIANLRQSADILDRAQKVRVGKGTWGRLAHGSMGPFAGIVAGGLSHGLEGAGVGVLLGLIVQTIPEQFLVRAMTRLDGVRALQAVQAAKTPIQLDVALKRLALAAGVGSAAQQGGRERLKQLQAEAQRLHPATGAAGGASKGSRSLGAAMALPVNQGKSEAEVEQHLRSLGYSVTRP
jgi:hypothetical protein